MSVTSICFNNFYIIGFTLLWIYLFSTKTNDTWNSKSFACYHDDIPNMKLAPELQLDAKLALILVTLELSMCRDYKVHQISTQPFVDKVEYTLVQKCWYS